MRNVVGACPLDCPDACSWVVTLDGDVPVKLRGNPDHPHTRKGLCTKVNPYLEYTKHPDRLRYPLRRTGAKGEGTFERISWDDALAEIAERLHGIVDEHGAEAIWPYRGTGSMGYIQGTYNSGARLWHTLGTSRHWGNICSAAGYPGLSYTSGMAPSMDPMDVVHSGVVLIWGANSVSTNQHWWAFARQAQQNGAEIVVVDPVTTRTARRADRHLAILPGTDGALALGLMAELVRIGAADTEGLEKAIGWDDFQADVLSQWSAARAADVCGIAVTEIEGLAELMATQGPTMVRLGMGMQRHAAAGQAVRLVACLPAVSGDYQRFGGGLCYSTNPLYGVNRFAVNRPDLQPDGPARRLPMTRLGHGLLDLDEPRIMALFVTAANPMASNPDQSRIRAGLAREDLFTVVVDNFVTDTADYADIVLPGTMQTEHDDLHDSVSHLYLNWNNAVVDPPGECLSHTEIFRRLAAAMGLDDPLLFASDLELAADALSGDHPAIAGIDLDELREVGFVRLNYPERYLPFADRYDTESGRFEFASIRAEQDGHGRLPHYEPPLEAGNPNGSLALVAAGNHFLMNSMFANSSDHERAANPALSIHPHDAGVRGLSGGDIVTVSNERGAFQAQLTIDPRQRQGVATMTKGHWPKHHGGSTVNATTLEHDADMGRGAIFHDNLVEVARTDFTSSGDNRS